jgi:serine/threonine protein kinase
MNADERLADLVAQWEEQADAGRRLTAADLCQDTPALADELQQRIDAVAWVRRMGGLDRAVVEPGSEPVRGYRLTSPLTRGGPGQLWRAAASGGEVDVRLLPRNGVAPSDVRNHGVMHPHVVGVIGVWKTADWVVVVSDPADRTLLDRLTETRAGIPHAELVGYIRGAAAGLDHLHSATGGIQHRDVQPRTLVLCGGVAKVSEFGLVAPGLVAGGPGGPTPAYAAPEQFVGATSRHTDQYGLAVTYCQLRMGELPHFRKPDLTMLPAAEQAVVGRALATRPGDRWSSCATFAEALAPVALDEPSSGLRATLEGLVRAAAAFASRVGPDRPRA